MKEENSYAYFANTACKYYPCHPGASEDFFNCLFCYCPLYALGRECGGNFVYLSSGIKDCSNCLIPHSRGGYEHVTTSFMKIMEMMEKNEGSKPGMAD